MKTFTFYFSEIGRETPRSLSAPKIEDSMGCLHPKFLQSEEWEPSVPITIGRLALLSFYKTHGNLRFLLP